VNISPAAPLDRAAVRGFERRLRGALLRPGDPGYDTARQVWNGLVDRRPALIARCVGVADVIAALDLARHTGVEPSLRSTGHNVTGCAVAADGIVIDLSPMLGLRVDPACRRVWAQPGVQWGALDHETQMFGLATTGGRISTTGVAGLTLGGGYGWLMRSCGLVVDNLLSVDAVLADGSFVHASETEQPDLFWGMRGGGGNFGVVTCFEYRLHRVGPLVTGGAAFYPTRSAEAVLRCYRRLMATAPDELAAQCNFLVAPRAPFVPSELHGVPVVAVAVCHTGSVEDARRDLACLGELGRPLLDRIRPMPYTAVQRLFDAAGRFGPMVHGRSGHLPQLSDGVIEILVRHVGRMTSPLSIVMISPLGGAVARVGEYDTAFSHRHAAYSYAINAVWTDPSQSEPSIRWAEELWNALRPYSEGVYVNELGNEGEGRVREAYTLPTYQRLVRLKERYDPTNLFRHNQNIPPTVTSQRPVPQ
jgi:FAD/FMN-containing dehydrogenase